MSRATVRAFGHDGRDPAEVLALLDEVLVTGEDGHARLIAAAYCILERTEERWLACVALAGHPPAALRRADGTVVEIGTPGTLLGCGLPSRLHTTAVWLDIGDTLVLHTDGVTEARAHDTRDLFDDDGLHRLLAALPPSTTAAQTADSVLEAVTRFSRGPLDDDVALVVLRNSPDGR